MQEGNDTLQSSNQEKSFCYVVFVRCLFLVLPDFEQRPNAYEQHGHKSPFFGYKHPLFSVIKGCCEDTSHTNDKCGDVNRLRGKIIVSHILSQRLLGKGSIGILRYRQRWLFGVGAQTAGSNRIGKPSALCTVQGFQPLQFPAMGRS